LVNQLGHSIADIRTLKLQKPIGESIGSPQFENMESRFSHRSLMDIHDNIVGIQTVFNGNNSNGLVKYTQANNMELAEEFNNRSQHCIELIQTMNQQGTLEEAILIDTQQIGILSDSLGYLQQFIQEDMLMSLSLWLTFNDSDGD
jgi:predicted lipoprotein